MINRDPISSSQLGTAVARLLDHYNPDNHGTNNGDNHDGLPDEEVDMDFEAALLAQGVISPHEAIDEFSFNHYAKSVTIILTTRAMPFTADIAGQVSVAK